MRPAGLRMTQPEEMKTTAYVYGVEKLNGYDAWTLFSAFAAGDMPPPAADAGGCRSPLIYVTSPAKPNSGKHVIYGNTVTGYRWKLLIDLPLHPRAVLAGKE